MQDVSDNLLVFHHPPRTDIHTLSLHDALPISVDGNLYYVGWVSHTLSKWDGKTTVVLNHTPGCDHNGLALTKQKTFLDRKSTRLNSSHRCISYAVFCLKKKKRSY